MRSNRHRKCIDILDTKQWPFGTVGLSSAPYGHGFLGRAPSSTAALRTARRNAYACRTAVMRPVVDTFACHVRIRSGVNRPIGVCPMCGTIHDRRLCSYVSRVRRKRPTLHGSLNDPRSGVLLEFDAASTGVEPSALHDGGFLGGEPSRGVGLGSKRRGRRIPPPVRTDVTDLPSSRRQPAERTESPPVAGHKTSRIASPPLCALMGQAHWLLSVARVTRLHPAQVPSGRPELQRARTFRLRPGATRLRRGSAQRSWRPGRRRSRRGGHEDGGAGSSILHQTIMK
jgi:hypothetical protein